MRVLYQPPDGSNCFQDIAFIGVCTLQYDADVPDVGCSLILPWTQFSTDISRSQSYMPHTPSHSGDAVVVVRSRVASPRASERMIDERPEVPILANRDVQEVHLYRPFIVIPNNIHDHQTQGPLSIWFLSTPHHLTII